MPKYRIELSDGRTFQVEADQPPSEQDVLAAVDQAQAPSSPPPPERSVGGFLDNVLSSGGRFVSDLVQPLLHPVQTAKGLGTAIANPRQTASAIGSALADRYGGLDAIKDTLYSDPVGVLADLSTLAGGAGLAAKAGGATKIANMAGRASTLTNPMTAVGAAAQPLLHEAANVAVRGTLRPSKAIRDDFGGGRRVADAVLHEKVYSDASASRKLTGSRQRADQIVADAEAAGTRGVSAKRIADAVTDQPMQTAERRRALGVPGTVDAVNSRRQQILTENAIPGHPHATRLIPLTEAQGLKHEAQDLAYEAAKNNLGLDQQANASIARALRQAIEERVPEIAPVNQQSQRLLGAQRAFADAQDRPRSLTNSLSVLGGIGGGAASGDLSTGLLTAALLKGLDSPRAGAMTGIAVDSVGKGLNAQSLRQAALLSRLLADDASQDE